MTNERIFTPDEAVALLLAAAEGGRLPGEEFEVDERVTILPVEPCGLCGETLTIRTATVTQSIDDEGRYEVALDDPIGIHLSGDGNGRCSGRVGLVRYRPDELELLDPEDDPQHADFAGDADAASLRPGTPESLLKEVLSTAVNIGLTESRRTLDELRSAVDRHPETAGLITAWESAIERLEALAGRPVASRRRQEVSDG